MKLTFLFLLLMVTLLSLGQTNKAKLRTAKYAGVFSHGKNIEEGSIGSISFYPESDTTVIFYIDLNRGAPSYNMGALCGRIKIINGKGIFKSSRDDVEICKWAFQFSKNILVIETLEHKDNCSFGGGVYADATYYRKSKKIPKSFINQEGERIYFDKIKPDDLD
jgi:hypothetical protein